MGGIIQENPKYCNGFENEHSVSNILTFIYYGCIVFTAKSREETMATRKQFFSLLITPFKVTGELIISAVAAVIDIYETSALRGTMLFLILMTVLVLLAMIFTDPVVTT